MNYRIILKAGFIAGLLDVLVSLIMYAIRTGKSPAIILKYIASGVFANKALTGGDIMVIAGLMFHFLIAIIFAFVFYVLVPRTSFFIRNKIITGIVYGIFVWVVMNLVVLPLSNAPKLPLDAEAVVTGVSILIICIGMPFAFIMLKRRNFEHSGKTMGTGSLNNR